MINNSEQIGIGNALKQEIYIPLERLLGKDSIAALHFTVTYKTSLESSYQVISFSIANKYYSELLQYYIGNHGPIGFHQKGLKETYASLNGEADTLANTDVRFDEFKINKITETRFSNFNTWNRFLNQNKFGKFSIWLNIFDKTNENWRYSVDGILILNIDIGNLLPHPQGELINANANNLKHWQFRTQIFDMLYSFSDNYAVGTFILELERYIEQQKMQVLRAAKNAERQAKLVAVGQLMARNMSHNIGSHVLSKVSRSIAGVDDIDLLKKSARLFEYLQKRMEFIANGVTPWFHYNYLLLSQVFSVYLSSPDTEGSSRWELQFLFDNISGNEKITSEKIIFQTSGVEGDFLVCIPNGTLGFHALYSLVENIIRNSVKHSKALPQENILSYTVKVETDSRFKDHYKITVSDNFGSINKNSPPDKDSINSDLNQGVLQNGSLRTKSWGLMEMKVCSIFLMGLPIEFIDQAHSHIGRTELINGIEQYFPPALSVSLDDEFNLSHIFYLQKPKIAALIGEYSHANTQGFEQVKDLNNFSEAGSRHMFAVFDKYELATQHEKQRNQRSIFLQSSAPTGKLSEKLLWRYYIEQNNFPDKKNVEIISKIINPAIQDKKYIIFDDHNKWAKTGSNWKDFLTQRAKFLYYESVSSNSITNEAICNQIVGSNNDISDTLLGRIYETVFTNIVVLDERIQKQLGADWLHPTSMQNPRFSNLFVPPFDKVTDLDSAKTKAITDWLESITGVRRNFQIDYLLIHRSITANDRINIKDIKGRFSPRYMVYISGGGTPPTIIDGDFYLPFEIVNYCIGTNVSKFALVDVLKNLRPVKKK